MKLSSLLMALAMSSTAWLQAQTFVSTAPSNRNAVLEEYTGIYCQFCPDGHVIANGIMANNPGRAWAINIHAGGFAEPDAGAPDFRTTVGNALDNYFPITGYPTGAVNRGTMSNRGQWAGQVTTQLGQASPVNLAARCTLDLDTRQLTMTVESYYTANGVGSADRLNVFLLQNNVEGPQTGAATYNPGGILPNGNYNHMHMLRHSLTGTWGTSLTPITATSFHSNQFTYTVPANYTGVVANLTDLEVIAFIANDTFAVQTAAKASITYVTNTPLRVQAVNGGVSVNVAGGIFCEASANPTISVLNTGANGITSIAGTYSVNGGAAVPFTHSPAAAVNTGGTLTFDVTNVTIPNIGANTAVFTVTTLNGQAVTVAPMNITLNRAAEIVSPVDSVRFSITFDNYPDETTWSFVNATTGATVATGGPYARPADNATTRVFMLPVVDGNCYLMQLSDAASDGICCGYGIGALSVSLGTTTLLSNPSFGAGAASKFNYSRAVGITRAEDAANNVRLYPNPTSSNLTIEFDLAQEADMNIEITNTLGQVVGKVANGNTAAGFHSLQISTANLSSGTYFVRFLDGNKATTQRFTVIR